MTNGEPDDRDEHPELYQFETVERGDHGAVVGVILLLVAIAFVGVVIYAVTKSDNNNTPTPVVTTTETVTPSPTLAKSEGGYEVAYTIITGVWQEKTNAEQKTICKGWELLPHDTVLDELESGLKGANEKIGVSDRQYRRAATDFFDKECK